MDNLISKYQTLAPEMQREVADFIDFIAYKSKKKNSFSLKAWKKQILNVSVWSSKDIKTLEENSQGLKSWKTQKW